MMRLKFFAERRDYGQQVALFAQGYVEGVKVSPAPVEWHEVGENLCIEEPFLRLETEDAQRLIDELWNAGLRPSQGKQSEGVAAAQERHLTDMRAIAFAKLNVEKP